MTYPYDLGFALSPASFEFARRIVASSDHRHHADLGPGSAEQDCDAELNWIGRHERLCVARSRHGGLLRIGVEDNTGDPATGDLVLEYACDGQPSEVLGQGTQEELKSMADRFEVSPALFRIAQDIGQIMRNCPARQLCNSNRQP